MNSFISNTTDAKDDDSALVTDHGITFDLESNVPTSGRRRRLSIHRRLSEVSLSEKVAPETVLPIAFKTISHRIEDQASLHYPNPNLDKKTKELSENTWHTDDIDTLTQTFRTNRSSGLSLQQHTEAYKKYGSNAQSKPPSGLFRKLLTYFFGGFGSLLMVGGVLCCISWKPLGQPPAIANLALGVVLFIVFLAQATFNFVQDISTSKVMDSIHGIMPSECQVVRAGELCVSQVRDLVPGDLVVIDTGTKVPADIRLVECSLDLAFDRSVLTGESKPIQGSTVPDLKGANYLESRCIAMQGSFCVTGTGRGIVVSTADDTVFGQIAKISSQPKKGLTPLQKEVLRFVIMTTGIIICLIVLVCILWGAWLRKDYPDWISVPTLIVDIVSVAVAFIPEGLPIALTTCLVITASVMRKNKILCKSLAVVETLGSVSVLCSDKTGTLTKNKMFVTDSCLGSEILNPYFQDEVSEKQEPIQNIDGIGHIHAVAGLCNSATFDPRTTHLPLVDRAMHSNATDQAILRFAEALAPTGELNMNWTMKSELSFNSKSKFMSRLYENNAAHSNFSCKEVGLTDPLSQYLFTIKGAPDILLSRCSHYLEGSIVVPLQENIRAKVMDIQNSWANQGKRVVLLASRIVNKDKELSKEFWSDPTESSAYLTSLSASRLTLVGMVGITDPPKDDIPEVVSTLRAAGIRLAMVTGDFELTAVAIARLCGIITKDSVDNARMLQDNIEICSQNSNPFEEIDKAIVITSSDIALLSEDEWRVLTKYSEIVFARATPDQKLRIVEQFQAQGHIVGMTGDGINDAPSLKQADVGIAMAEGSDIAKEASDLVLLESFSSMVIALKYGRLVFENLRKTIAYLLPAGTFAELWPVLLNVIFGLPQALSSFCMIIICCLTDCAGAITLAYEAPESNLLLKKPRSVTGERLVDMKLFMHSYFTIGTYYAFTSMLVCFLYFQRKGIPFKNLTLSYGDFGEITSESVANVGESASSVYFVNLVIMQFFNLMAVRTRHLSIFQHPPIMNPLTNNYLAFVAIVFALGVTFFFNYIPWFNKVLGTGHVPVEYYFIAVGFGAVVLLYDEIRKYYVRKYPKSILAKMAW